MFIPRQQLAEEAIKREEVVRKMIEEEKLQANLESLYATSPKDIEERIQWLRESTPEEIKRVLAAENSGSVS